MVEDAGDSDAVGVDVPGTDATGLELAGVLVGDDPPHPARRAAVRMGTASASPFIRISLRWRTIVRLRVLLWGVRRRHIREAVNSTA